MTEKKQSEHITNQKYTEIDTFRSFCEKADVNPSKRQASKFRRGKGAAWRARFMSMKEASNG